MQATPAIVSQDAVRRLPRLALYLFCVAYVLPGLWFREAWKSVDLTSLGFMLALAHNESDWWHPTLFGQTPELDALIPYWLGAWSIQWLSPWLSAAKAVRVPFIGLGFLSLGFTWYAVYSLSKSQHAKPVAFAFGGEANHNDYARAMADAALLALISCLGLAQPLHEVTPMLAQFAFITVAFAALASLPYHHHLSICLFGLGLLGLGFSGAPSLALLLGSIALGITYFDKELPQGKTSALYLLTLTLLVAWLIPSHMWHWRIQWPEMTLTHWHGQLRLWLWFTWPAWPLSFWTLWRWRNHWLAWPLSRHLLIPLSLGLLCALASMLSVPPERVLLLSLPFFSALAAFALPTLQRSVSALIDWFTLIFFSGCAFIIWVVWLAMQTGWPPQPAANVARLLPGFVPSFGMSAFVVALLATLTWMGLVRWRTGQHRAAIWKSLVLPAAGAALCWLLLMSLWLPLLDYARSYIPMIKAVETQVYSKHVCFKDLSLAQITAFQIHSDLEFHRFDPEKKNDCQWLITESDHRGHAPSATTSPRVEGYEWIKTIPRPSDDNQELDLLRKSNP
jgi:hypothetical protein